jgi:prepilin-type N-terminal cleavage/methylation domain-containing protein
MQCQPDQDPPDQKPNELPKSVCKISVNRQILTTSMQIVDMPPHSGRDHAGFSLIELLVTIAILSIIVAIAIGAFGGARQGAEDQKDKRNAQEIASIATNAERSKTCAMDVPRHVVR